MGKSCPSVILILGWKGPQTPYASFKVSKKKMKIVFPNHVDFCSISDFF